MVIIIAADSGGAVTLDAANYALRHGLVDCLCMPVNPLYSQAQVQQSLPQQDKSLVKLLNLACLLRGIQLVCLDPNRMLGLGMQPAAADRVA